MGANRNFAVGWAGRLPVWVAPDAVVVVFEVAGPVPGVAVACALCPAEAPGVAVAPGAGVLSGFLVLGVDQLW